MNSDKTGSVASSGAQSPSRQPQATTSEAEFLSRQISDASAAMGKTLHEMTDALKDTANLRAWMGEYPWVTLGASAVGGFFLASALTPTRDESFKERIKSLFPEAPPGAAAAVPGPTQVAAAKAAPTAGGGMMSGVMVHVMDALKTALVSTLSSAVTSKVQQDAGKPPENPARNSGQPANDPTAAAGVR